MSGYIKISRKMLEWEWYKNINTCRLFIHMILKANWKNGKFEGVDIPRGSFVSSLPILASETSLTINEVRTAISHLKTTGEITGKSHKKFTVFTIKNYTLYQDINTDINTETTCNPHAINMRLTTIEEVKKEIREESNNTIVSNDTICQTDVQRVVAKWNELSAFGIKPIKKLSSGTKRYDCLKARIKQYGIDDVLQAVENIKVSSYLQGSKGWTITFDWFVKPNNFPKVLEGNYDDNNKTFGSAGTHQIKEQIHINRFNCIPLDERNYLESRGIIDCKTECMKLGDADKDDLRILEKYHLVTNVD